MGQKTLRQFHGEITTRLQAAWREAREAVKLSQEMEAAMVTSKARKRFTSELKVVAGSITVAAEKLREIDRRECPEAHQRESETFTHPCQPVGGMGEY